MFLQVVDDYVWMMNLVYWGHPCMRTRLLQVLEWYQD